MSFLFFFLLAIPAFSKEIRLALDPNSYAVKFTIHEPVFLSFTPNNISISLYQSNKCPSFQCPYCDHTHIEQIPFQNLTNKCGSTVKITDFPYNLTKNSQIQLYFLNNRSTSNKEFQNNSVQGFFGLKLLKSLVLTNKVFKKKVVSIDFPQNKIVIGRTNENIKFGVSYTSFYTIKANFYEIYTKKYEDKTRDIVFTTEISGLILPFNIYKTLTNFLKGAKAGCKINYKPHQGLYCANQRRNRKLLKKLIKFRLENNLDLVIPIGKLLKVCGHKYCHSMIYSHKSEKIVFGKEFLQEFVLSVDFINKSFGFSPKKNETLMQFQETKDEYIVKKDESFKINMLDWKFFLKAIVFFAFLAISSVLAKKVYSWMTATIERSLPNYQRTSNNEDQAATNSSFRAISQEIKKARANLRTKPQIFSS